MSGKCNRRNFIPDSALLPLCVAAGGLALAGGRVAGQTPFKRCGDAKLKISLNAYSFAKLGAPVLRVFAGAIPPGYEDKWEEVARRMVADLKQCVQHAEQYGVMIGIQNHGDMLQSADQVIKIIQMVDSPWFGAINDTGYYTTADPYANMARVVPYTVNWQVKQRLGGKEGTAPMDLKKLFGLIKAGGCRGYVPIEVSSQRGKEYDPFTLVPQFLKKVRQAIAETA